MNISRILRIDAEDPEAVFRTFLAAWWARLGLRALLAPVQQPGWPPVEPQILTDPARVADIQPFEPIMISNTAGLIAELRSKHPGGRVAALLRPCELRTLIELDKRNGAGAPARGAGDPGMIRIGLDCLGTVPVNDYSRPGSGQASARQNGGLASASEMSPDGLRPACQVCADLVPAEAEVSVGTIGVIEEGALLIMARDAYLDSSLELGPVTHGMASAAQIARHEWAIRAVQRARASQKRRRLGNEAPGGLGSLLASISRCTLCTDCLDACPLYQGELTGLLGVGSTRDRDRPLLSELVGLSRWLVSCTGCGMCEAACERGVPLSRILSQVSHQIRTELDYQLGDPAHRLPWMPDRKGSRGP